MTDRSDRDRLRYANDPAVRARVLAGNARYRKRNAKKINAQRRVRYATDPDYRQRKREEDRAGELMRLYGITVAEYNALFARQKGRCAICKKKPDRRLNVDHCHRRKVVRGLLCGNCNLAIGLLNDDPRLVPPAVAYLTRALKAKPRQGSAKPAR